MPFTKQADGNYTSPSGRVFTPAQVKLYYATDGFSKKPKPKKSTFQQSYSNQSKLG